MDKSKSISAIEDLEISFGNDSKLTKDTSINILNLEKEEAALIKRVFNDSNNNLQAFENKKLKEDSILSLEVNQTKWDLLRGNPEKNYNALETEYKKLQASHEELFKSRGFLESRLEESKKKKCDEVKAFSEDMMRRLESLEKEVQRVRDEREIALTQLKQLEIEKEAQRLQYLSEKKSHKDIKEKASDSIKLVKNLLKQKNELQNCLEEAKKKLDNLTIASTNELEKTKVNAKMDAIETLINQDQSKSSKSKRFSKTRKTEKKTNP